ncbi:hypothetical protein [Methanoregula sp.]|uniref:hypothetical protein n=1 Tax=Methanoregula sp. TaxID=2052170 RepID=UPI00236F8573|nr:hypothetical protein [Methanoregula sp.]MDD1687020.1 hypothetical protein [Methanoregula sp.]
MMTTSVFCRENGEYFFVQYRIRNTPPGYFLQHVNGTPLAVPDSTLHQPDFKTDPPQTSRLVTLTESGNNFQQAYSATNPNPGSVSIVSNPNVPISPPGPDTVVP